eukprot:755457-Hanusia_phi.AAC.4
MAVHLYGHPCDMDAINAIAKEHGIQVMEDAGREEEAGGRREDEKLPSAAEAHGAMYKGRPVGSLSSFATFSFYANKAGAPACAAARACDRSAGHDNGRRRNR